MCDLYADRHVYKEVTEVTAHAQLAESMMELIAKTNLYSDYLVIKTSKSRLWAKPGPTFSGRPRGTVHILRMRKQNKMYHSSSYIVGLGDGPSKVCRTPRPMPGSLWKVLVVVLGKDMGSE